VFTVEENWGCTHCESQDLPSPGELEGLLGLLNRFFERSFRQLPPQGQW
jgi:hypothetical protein